MAEVAPRHREAQQPEVRKAAASWRGYWTGRIRALTPNPLRTGRVTHWKEPGLPRGKLVHVTTTKSTTRSPDNEKTVSLVSH